VRLLWVPDLAMTLIVSERGIDVGGVCGDIYLKFLSTGRCACFVAAVSHFSC
jgi:hypothetical protein